MSKYGPGETSQSVIDTRDEITNSILQKSKELDRIKSYDDIPQSLEMKSSSVSILAVHKWHDEKLKVIAYSYNTSKAKHNREALKLLLASISNLNNRLKNSPKQAQNSELEEVKEENNELRQALAEVYRAYMQLVGRYREDREIDAALRTMILDQARVLGRHRIRNVK